MPEPEWGVKRLCPSCGARFYDLNHDPATCPECGGSFSIEQLSLKRARPDRVEAKAPAKPVPVADDEDDLLDDDEDLDVDDDLLEDDEDDDEVPLDDIAEPSPEDPDS
ncbi:MAG: TIGR02300 family protein [Alphaproteobacteria bacterium]|nr:MAG: TIGR02300 family protein [Alphaproteobacteria bacterium]